MERILTVLASETFARGEARGEAGAGALMGS